MVDFFMISTRPSKQGVIEIYPKFIIKNPSEDLMIRGSDFYAIWIEEKGIWSHNEIDALMLIDRELDIFAEENRQKFNSAIRVLHMWDSENGMIDKWHKYCQKQMRDSYHVLDEKIIFSNDKTCKTDYASKRLPYPLESCPIDAYERLMSVLYSPEERKKIEWSIGAIVKGDSKYIQKFVVLYGAAGTGKSTVLNIIQQLFDGYYSVFDAKSLGSSSNAFALEAFKGNPLVAIQHDGDLSRIEDNSRLNSLVSHELMTVNEKFKSTYSNRFNAFLFMGTNRPVKITDAKSGLIRRLIDISPSGNKVSAKEYKSLVKQIGFELGGIAKHCLDVYESDPGAYDNYIPISMLDASNDFYNFVMDSFFIFTREDGITMKAAWEMYKTYCNEASVLYPFSQRVFKEELKNYFKDYYDRYTLEDGTRVRSYYSKFLEDKFQSIREKEEDEEKPRLIFSEGPSILDLVCADCRAQYASAKETPLQKWSEVTTTLNDIDTSRLHYVKLPTNHIVIDFDIPGEDGTKSFEKNLEAASKWPNTYAELSKSGSGIHLHYIYNGDVSKLSRLYSENIEIKIFNGNSSLRRKLTKCNGEQIATINSGLPLKGEKMVDVKVAKSEKALRSSIIKNLNKEVWPNTKPSMDFIFKILEDAYNSDLTYDVSDMRPAIIAFAAGSSHQSEYCLKLVSKMQFKSKDVEQLNSYNDVNNDSRVIFFDVEVFPNLFLLCWKFKGEDKKVVKIFNPKPAQIEELLQYKLIGFNNRRYDNHILYAAYMGYSNEQLYNLSQKIVSGNLNCFFGEAYHLSYTDIYDFASAGNKKSLKKLEIEMGIHHKELGLPWDQPVDESKWELVAEYCANDVIATEAAFGYLESDWMARRILADLAGMTVNDTTNSLTTRFIFGANKKPQEMFNYRDLSKPVLELPEKELIFLKDACPVMMSRRHGEAKSLLPYFPGYSYDNGKSIYKGVEVGEGGYVYAEPGMYTDVALLDISSMHPHSIIAEALFGVEFTRIFRDIVESRVSIKHKAWDELDRALDGKLTPYIAKVKNGEITAKSLADALKTAINSVYGLTAASFDNAFRDIRNKDNIVAKRGALFMVDLKEEVQKRGFTVAHIKTDSIKIPNATQEIIDFVMDFGQRYGYSFEHEDTYQKMCLVNDAVYIAKDSKGKWTATGTQFQVPYVFKTLFSKEPITFDDLCETKSVSTALYLDKNEKLEDVSGYEKELSKLETMYKKGQLSDTTFEPQARELSEKIDKGHNLIFVGKVGRFCPIEKGYGGGLLMRENKGKYYAVSGSKGYRWDESENVLEIGKQDHIDISYFNRLADEAIETINLYGDYEWFVSDDMTTPQMDIPCV